MLQCAPSTVRTPISEIELYNEHKVVPSFAFSGILALIMSTHQLPFVLHF